MNGTKSRKAPQITLEYFEKIEAGVGEGSCFNNLTETIFLKVNVQSSKWLFVGCYKPPSQNEEFFLVVYLRL